MLIYGEGVTTLSREDVSLKHTVVQEGGLRQQGHATKNISSPEETLLQYSTG